MRVMSARCWMVAVAAVFLGGSLVVAQGPGMGAMGGGMGFGQRRPPMERALGAQGRGGQWWNNPNMVTQLKLTDDQRKAMDGIMLQHQKTLIDLRGNLEKAELDMQPLMKADQPNETQILAQIDKVASARAELEKGNARFLLALRAKLTADQWKQVQTMRANNMQPPAPAGGQAPAAGQARGMQGRGMQGQWRARPGVRQAPPPPPPAQGGTQAAPAPAPGTGLSQ